jgi:hypothetical protein
MVSRRKATGQEHSALARCEIAVATITRPHADPKKFERSREKKRVLLSRRHFLLFARDSRDLRIRD